MAVSDIEAVLLFLKKNGFTEAENAFKQDISEKKDLKSFDFEKFEFPISPPPPPPVRIGLDHRQFQVSNVFYASSDNSDDSSSLIL
ncbi:hypothetical protein ACHQM5_027053 [Ranunculus cassubicifolius]